jgi:glycosyltransferase involved in cell wall biosynthesis
MGSGPRFAAMLADGLRGLPGVTPALCLSSRADVLAGGNRPECALLVPTYNGLASFIFRVLAAPAMVLSLRRRLRVLAPDLAVCGHPGPLDLIMSIALRSLRVPIAVIVHDADLHPGDGWPFLMRLQRALCRSADFVASLTTHVGRRLVEQDLAGPNGERLIRLFLPPMRYPGGPERVPDGRLRLLFFGRLLPYKGPDLLLETLQALGPRPDVLVRVVGSGPSSPILDALSALPGVEIDRRWVPEDELGAVFGWADALILPYREASQSGVAAIGLAAGRGIIATNVGGLAEQLAGQPGVTLCPPDPMRLADAVRRLAESGGGAEPARVDADAAWRDMARDLLLGATGKGGGA